jgi:large subunit ribosomal protein L18
MKNKILKQRKKRQVRVRSRIIRQSEYPRMSIHRSNKYLYVQVIDDFKHKTLVSSTDVSKKDIKGSKTDHAKFIGKDIAEKLKAIKVKQVVLDRGSYQYNGRIKALAESIRENGITI